MNNPQKHNRTESIDIAILLSLVGGFLDIYTYLYRGEVFANAVTGNIVLFGLHLISFNWLHSFGYFAAVAAYGLGVFVADWICHKQSVSLGISRFQKVILVEIFVLFTIPFIPFGGAWDQLVLIVVPFVCAMQVQTFRKVRHLPYASTMCTGNLRSGSEAFSRAIFYKDKQLFSDAMLYFFVITCFTLGATVGAIGFNLLGPNLIVIAPIVLLYVVYLIHYKSDPKEL